MESLKKVAVIGGGIAGAQAASLLKGMDVTIIAGESYLPYYRMRIGEIISGKDPQTLLMHPSSWYEDKGIRIIHGRAERIDASACRIELSDGSSLDYDYAIIATGSEARTLSLPGGRKESFVLRSADDAISLRRALSSADSFAVIGGGLLGLELAMEAAQIFSIPVSVVESAEHLLPRQLDRDSAAAVQAYLQGKGVEVLTSAETSSADDSFVYLKDGRRIPAAVLAFSVGVIPSKDIAEKSGIKSGKGIIVDHHLMTSAPRVYAAGDAVELDGRTFGLALHAREMGTAAAKAVMGEEVEYIPSEPSALLKIGGMDVASFGTIDGEMRVEADGNRRRTLFIRDGIVKGAVLINDKAGMMAVKEMIGKPF